MSWGVGRKLPHNSTVNNPMNNSKQTLKKRRQVWITSGDWIWSALLALLSDAEVRHALLRAEPKLPVIAF